MNNWKHWLKGLTAAAIGGAANSVTVVIVDPISFDPAIHGRKLLMVALISGLISAALYLKQSPLPE